MYLFMDVLFNQPRNIGSSTSLTTSIALVLKFHNINIRFISGCFHFTLIDPQCIHGMTLQVVSLGCFNSDSLSLIHHGPCQAYCRDPNFV